MLAWVLQRQILIQGFKGKVSAAPATQGGFALKAALQVGLELHPAGKLWEILQIHTPELLLVVWGSQVVYTSTTMDWCMCRPQFICWNPSPVWGC